MMRIKSWSVYIRIQSRKLANQLRWAINSYLWPSRIDIAVFGVRGSPDYPKHKDNLHVDGNADGDISVGGSSKAVIVVHTGDPVTGNSGSGGRTGTGTTGSTTGSTSKVLLYYQWYYCSYCTGNSATGNSGSPGSHGDGGGGDSGLMLKDSVDVADH